MRRGFSLVEVVVALVVLEIGVLGVMSLLVVASKTLGRAYTVEVGVAALEGLADSLLADGWSTDGARPTDGGTLRWTRTADGDAVLGFEPPEAHGGPLRMSLAADLLP